MADLITIDDLTVEFTLREGRFQAVDGVSLSIPENRTMGLVGESGCGKTVTARAMMQILPRRAQISAGSILLSPRPDDPQKTPVDIAALPPNSADMRAIRGADIAMIFQEPMTSFSPVHTIGNQIAESVRQHSRSTAAEARDKTIETLRLAQMPRPEQRIDAYPHELSGGLRQRAMIAMALSCGPRLLVADEPTTALDVTIQAQILNLMENLQHELGMAVLMITHDLGVIAETADEVAVMYLGRIVEQSLVDELFADPRHPYTQGLLASIPRLGAPVGKRLRAIPGSVPPPMRKPAGCPFHPRCPKCTPGLCDAEHPPALRTIAPGRKAACFLCEGYDDSDTVP